MPGRYISDTVQHCITVTKRIRVPRFMPWRFFPVTSYPPVFGTLSTHVFRYGDPVVPGVHELSKATLMADEKPYVYHLLPASQHIGGAVLKAAAGPDSTAEYTIDLGGEPAPVYSYLHLHPDTALAVQPLNVTVHHSPGVLVEARIRQYNASGVEDFSVPLDWQPLPEGQPYALDFATDVTAIVAGGATMLEYRTSPVGGGTFAAASEVTYTSTIVTVSLSELWDVLVTICDEKDNYRFGFNGQEKDNEIRGIGNSLNFTYRMEDTRLGRFFAVDPLASKYPYLSTYQFAGNTPVWARELEGLEPWYSTEGVNQADVPRTEEGNYDMGSIKPDKYGPYTSEYAESKGYESHPTINLPEVEVSLGAGTNSRTRASQMDQIINSDKYYNAAYHPYTPQSPDYIGLHFSANFIFGGGAGANVGIGWLKNEGLTITWETGGGVGLDMGFGAGLKWAYSQKGTNASSLQSFVGTDVEAGAQALIGITHARDLSYERGKPELGLNWRSYQLSAGLEVQGGVQVTHSWGTSYKEIIESFKTTNIE